MIIDTWHKTDTIQVLDRGQIAITTGSAPPSPHQIILNLSLLTVWSILFAGGEWHMRVPVAVREGFSTGRLCSRTYVGKSLQVSRPLDPFVERKCSQSRFLIIALWSTVHISKGIGSFTTLNDKVKIDVSYHFK